MKQYANEIFRHPGSVEVKWAFIFMGISFIWMLGEKVFGLHDLYIDKHFQYTQFFLMPVILTYVLALRDKRRAECSMMMTYKEGLVAGVQISALITILTPFIQLINLELISPGFFEKAIEYNVSVGRFSQAEAERYFSLKNFIIQSMTGVTVVGNSASIVTAYFTKSA